MIAIRFVHGNIVKVIIYLVPFRSFNGTCTMLANNIGKIFKPKPHSTYSHTYPNASQDAGF